MYQLKATITIYPSSRDIYDNTYCLDNMAHQTLDDILNSLNLSYDYHHSLRTPGETPLLKTEAHHVLRVRIESKEVLMKHVVHLTQILQSICLLYDDPNDARFHFQLHEE